VKVLECNSLWTQAYLERKREKEIRMKEATKREVLHKEFEHQRPQRLPGDLHKRFILEKNFAKAVEKYLMKLMTYVSTASSPSKE
jgi:DNA-binding TFAR19-related protein (PDSD5 family)